jgi:sugar-specific transcriptional regulator TrmB
MDYSILEEIGLTNAQIKVYIALLKRGTTTAGPLLDETALQNSTLHKTLNKLVKDGLASFIVKGKIRHYRAVDPSTILKIMKVRQSRFLELLPALKSLQIPTERHDVEVYEGIKGLENMLYELIKGAKRGDEFLFFAFYTKNREDLEKVFRLYVGFDKERERIGIVAKGVVPSYLKSEFLRSGRKERNVKFLDFPILLNMSVFRDRVIFTPWQDKEISFLVYSKQLAESFRQYFYSIYNN